MDGGGIPPVIQRDKKPSAYRPGREGGNGPPEGKFTRLGGKVTFGVLSSKINVIRANKRAIILIFMLKAIFLDFTNMSAGIQRKNNFTHQV